MKRIRRFYKSKSMAFRNSQNDVASISETRWISSGRILCISRRKLVGICWLVADYHPFCQRGSQHELEAHIKTHWKILKKTFLSVTHTFLSFTGPHTSSSVGRVSPPGEVDPGSILIQVIPNSLQQEALTSSLGIRPWGKMKRCLDLYHCNGSHGAAYLALITLHTLWGFPCSRHMTEKITY